MDEPGNALSAWESFYVIVGSSGGALIGLQFVVITLIAERRHDSTLGAVGAFGTPTVVHFTGALVLSALMSIPWRSLMALSAALGFCGLIGLIYAVIVIRRARRQTEYKPVLEDWIWFTALPFCSYAALILGALLLHANARSALFVVATVALGLLLIGIHNAWDSITHIIVSSSDTDTKKEN